MSSTAFAFDLDGTVTRRELLPLIASELGLSDEMELLTQLTLSGAIPFEKSFRLRCAILKSIPLSTVQQIVAEVPLDREIAGFIERNSDRCYLVTGNLDVWIRPIIERLGCRAYTSIGIPDQNSLREVAEVLVKSRAVHDIRRRHDRVVAIGESVNDIPMFQEADIGVAFGGVHPPVPELLDNAQFAAFTGASLCRFLSTLL